MADGIRSDALDNVINGADDQSDEHLIQSLFSWKLGNNFANSPITSKSLWRESHTHVVVPIILL